MSDDSLAVQVARLQTKLDAARDNAVRWDQMVMRQDEVIARLRAVIKQIAETVRARVTATTSGTATVYMECPCGRRLS